MNDIFNVQIFFVVFREALEAVIVVSVLLAFVKQSIGSKNPEITKKLVRQIWFGTFAGIFICLAIGCAFIGAYYSLKNDIWSRTEDLYEGIMCMIATILITMMGIAMLRVNKMQAKWRVKIARSLVAPPESKSERLMWLYHEEILYVYLALHHYIKRGFRSSRFRRWCWYRLLCKIFPATGGLWVASRCSCWWVHVLRRICNFFTDFPVYLNCYSIFDFSRIILQRCLVLRELRI